MNSKHILAIALAATFAAPVFAQGAGGGGAAASGTTAGTPAPASTSVNVNTNTGSKAAPGAQGQVASGTGLAVQPATAVVAPVATVPAPGVRVLPGSAMVQHSSSSATLGAAAVGTASTSQTIVTQHWVNMPADGNHRGDFQRWQSLK